MKAARIHEFGDVDVIRIDDIPRPAPGPGELLVRVAAAGVGPWDAWIREKQSEVSVPLPIILGSDLSGTVEALGPGITSFVPGEAVYGATNPQFCGAYTEFAIVNASMMARKPASLDFLAAASAPIVGVTALQMLHDYAHAQPGQSVLIHGAAGSVGAYAVQLARQAGLTIYATSAARDFEYLRSLGATTLIDYKSETFERVIPKLDVVLDLVGGEIRQRSFAVLKPGGILVSAVSPVPPEEIPAGLRGVFFLVEVTTERLNSLSTLFDSGKLKARVGEVLPLDEARAAHRMLAGATHKPGKIVLQVSTPG